MIFLAILLPKINRLKMKWMDEMEEGEKILTGAIAITKLK